MLSVMCDLCFERENLLCCCSPYTHVTHSCATGSRPSSGAGKCFSTASKSDNMSGSQRKCPIIWTQSSLLTEYELVSIHCPEKKARERQGHYSGARCFQVCQLIHGILISLTRDWDAGCLTHTHTRVIIFLLYPELTLVHALFILHMQTNSFSFPHSFISVALCLSVLFHLCLSPPVRLFNSLTTFVTKWSSALDTSIPL